MLTFGMKMKININKIVIYDDYKYLCCEILNSL